MPPSRAVSPLEEVSPVLRRFSLCCGFPLWVGRDGSVGRSAALVAYTLLPGTFKLTSLLVLVLSLGLDKVRKCIHEWFFFRSNFVLVQVLEKGRELYGTVEALGLTALDAGSQFFLMAVTVVSIASHVVVAVRSKERLVRLSDHLKGISHYFAAKVIG